MKTRSSSHTVRAMVRSKRKKLIGEIEVDETYIGGRETGSTIITDGWSGYNFLTNSKKYKHVEKVTLSSYQCERFNLKML